MDSKFFKNWKSKNLQFQFFWKFSKPKNLPVLIFLNFGPPWFLPGSISWPKNRLFCTTVLSSKEPDHMTDLKQVLWWLWTGSLNYQFASLGSRCWQFVRSFVSLILLDDVVHKLVFNVKMATKHPLHLIYINHFISIAIMYSLTQFRNKLLNN